MSRKKSRQPQSSGMQPDDVTMHVVSGTECTGTVPTPPLGDGEANSYSEIGDLPIRRDLVGDPPEKPRPRQ